MPPSLPAAERKPGLLGCAQEPGNPHPALKQGIFLQSILKKKTKYMYLKNKIKSAQPSPAWEGNISSGMVGRDKYLGFYSKAWGHLSTQSIPSSCGSQARMPGLVLSERHQKCLILEAGGYFSPPTSVLWMAANHELPHT